MVSIGFKKHKNSRQNKAHLLTTQKTSTLKILKNIIFLFLALQLCPVFSQTQPPRKTIVIDPGHGGINLGAIGTNGIKEKDITLKVAQQILILNRTLFENKYEITLTRYRD